VNTWCNCAEPGDCIVCAPVYHTKDSDCTLDADGSCIDCGVYHGEPCDVCGGRGFHVAECPCEHDPDSDEYATDWAAWYVSSHLDHIRRNRRHDSLDPQQDLRATAELIAVTDTNEEEPR
jgi:hypothetical protein